eukprot:2996943-Rhodomonas_salina.1
MSGEHGPSRGAPMLVPADPDFGPRDPGREHGLRHLSDGSLRLTGPKGSSAASASTATRPVEDGP